MSTIILAHLAAFLLGVSKAGLKGMGIIVVALLVIVYGAKASTGILLPLLLVGDVMAVVYYNRHAKWNYLIKFLPAMMIGVVIGWYFGKDLPDEIFKKCMSIIILISVAIMFYRDYYDKNEFPNNWFFAGATGVAAGFATMIGNLAGAFANLFFLATRLPKNELIGTAAWLFFIINLFKVPFHVFSWKTITIETLTLNLSLIPTIIVGFIVGLKLVALFSELNYRRFLLVVTAIGAVIIFLK